MAEPVARPEGYGRTPTDDPGVSRQELDRRQAGKLNASRNGELDNGRATPFVTPNASRT